jgi:serine protease
MSPCSAPSAITVGASTDKDSMASYSNIGSCLSLFAPGSYITSAGRTSDSAEATMSGTSMAAPHVAGVAALYLSYRPGASPAEVKAAITGASVPRYFQSRSPQRLLNAVSARLRAAGPRVGPAPPPPSPAKPSPAPVTTPSKPVAPAPAKPSPSPKPAAPSPKPAAPAPKPVSPPPPPPPPSRPVFAPGLFDKTMCAACPWCMFC